MIRFILACGLIAVGAWPSSEQKIDSVIQAAPASIPDEFKEEAKPSPFIFANYVSTEAPVDAPVTTEECDCENCNCDPCECKKPDSGWQPVEGASTQTVNTTGSAGSYAAASSAGSYAASSAGSYAASSAGSYGSHRQPVRRVAKAILRPFQGIRTRMAARRAGRQSARHVSHSAHAAPRAVACLTCR